LSICNGIQRKQTTVSDFRRWSFNRSFSGPQDPENGICCCGEEEEEEDRVRERTNVPGTGRFVHHRYVAFL